MGKSLEDIDLLFRKGVSARKFDVVDMKELKRQFDSLDDFSSTPSKDVESHKMEETIADQPTTILNGEPTMPEATSMSKDTVGVAPKTIKQ